MTVARAMSSAMHPTPDAILAANVAYHSALAEDYDRTQPHFRPENVDRIARILEQLARETGGGSLLDLGCGTGFIINIARRYFDRVVGVDITQAMLDLVDTNSGNIELLKTPTDSIPLPDESFDVCTANSYLHHLYEIEPTLSEAARLLRPGGRFFADQDPNRPFWEHFSKLQGDPRVDGFVGREVEAVSGSATQVAAATNLNAEDVSLAEFQKLTLGGFDGDRVVEQLLAAGFHEASYTHHWYVGQGVVLHRDGPAAAAMIENYLRSALPATEHLFKYVTFNATK